MNALENVILPMVYAGVAGSVRRERGHVALGEALSALHDVRRGEASLREAVSIAPQSPDAHVALGSLYWSVGRLVDAEAELKRAVALAPTVAVRPALSRPPHFQARVARW